MKNRKETELQKYLEKKHKQKNRDELMKQIVGLTSTKDKKSIKLTRSKLKMKCSNKNEFDSKLLNDSEDVEMNVFIENTCKEYDNSFDTEASNPKNYIPAEIMQIQNDDFKNNSTVDKVLNEDLATENFNVWRCPNRDELIQTKRMKLDIFYEESDIISIIKNNLITIIQGSTGCGKTTQIPQFLFENGFSNKGMICITQPRRFSAISISKRINQEMNEVFCGYKIKYENNITEETRIKVVTEGVLFKEIQSDFLLQKYSVIILDEVHERSTNSDILVGLLSKIVKRRFEMKNTLRIILMSATLDVNCYKKIFGDYALIELKSKPHEISIFYEDTTVEDYNDAIFHKIAAILDSEKRIKTNKKTNEKLCRIPMTVSNSHEASILVFLPGKDDINKLKDKLYQFNNNLVVLPLYSGMSRNEQSNVYRKYDYRKIILSTNIAETSITIDDIVFVIDCGRVKRKITDQNSILYKIDFISKSSAKQRAGRCGRTGPGVCYRMYSGSFFEQLRDADVPQILLEPFDMSLLQFKGMGISNVFGFPFVDQPNEGLIKDAIKSLQYVKALDSCGNLTNLGKSMCQYPVIPRLSRILLSSLGLNQSIYAKIIIIISILSCNFELKKNDETLIYYNSAKSDLIVSLRIFIHNFKLARSKRSFKQVGLTYESYKEILKMSTYLMAISKKGSIEDILIDGTDDEDQLCKLLFFSFADQLAVNCGSHYLFKEGCISISPNSIKSEGLNFVFNYIICGRNGSTASHITLVDPSWFK